MSRHKEKLSEESESLRQQAERKLRLDTAAVEEASEAEAAVLVHELRVHQIELEMQNEELHKTQTELEQSRSKYAELFDFAPVGYLVFDAKGLVVQANLMAASMLGRDRSQVAGRPFSLHVAPTSQDTWRLHYGAVFKTGTSQQGEIEVIGKDQAHSPVRLHSRPVLESGNKVVQCRTAMLDVTARRQLEQKLGESEERYRTVVESAGEAIAIVDEQGTFLFMNNTAARALGGEPSVLVGKTMWELFPQDIADRQMSTIRKAIGMGKGVNSVVLSAVGGQQRWYNTTVEPLRDAAGRVTSGLVIARDIHELRTAQQELETYREKMMRAEHLASVGTLSAMLSHEMMQPLTVIRLAIQNALEALAGASARPRRAAARRATVREDLEDGLAGVSDAAAIVGRFRDFARRTSDGKIETVSLSAVAHRMVRLLEEGARKARVKLEVSQLDELPPLQAKGRDLEQVLFALAQNAIQAADGTRERFFRIVGTCGDDAVELRFTDNCGGIDPEILGHVFDPFVTTKSPGEGTGLGLCVVRRIVSQAGGRMTVDSRWGEGTTFFVTLPIGFAKTPGSTPTRSPDAQRPSGPGAGQEGATP